MNFINAIAKARFSSAKPQRVQLCRESDLQADLLCLEAKQEMAVKGGVWMYYIVTGTALFTAGESSSKLPQGQMACSKDEPHTIANHEDRRLLCIAIGHNGTAG